MRFSPPCYLPTPIQGVGGERSETEGGRLRYGPLCGPGSEDSGHHRAPPRAARVRPGNGFRPLSESDAQPAAGRRPQPSGCSPVNPHIEGVSKGKKQKWHRPPIGGQDSDGVSNRCSALYTLSRFAGLPLKGKREVWKEKTESHIFHVPFRSFFPPFGGKRSELIIRMRIMPYDL